MARGRFLSAASIVALGIVGALNLRADITSGLVAYWDFEEGGGGTILDQSGNEHHGDAQEAFTHSAQACPFAPSQWAGDFGDPGGYVSVPDHPELDPTGDFTLAAWVYNIPASEYIGGHLVFCKGQQWYLGLDPRDTPADPTCAGLYFCTPAVGEVYSTGSFALDEWHHVAMTYKYVTNTLTFWIDGVPESETRSLDIGDNDYELRLGGNNSGPDYAGLLDELRIYDRALSACDIQELIAGSGDPVALFVDDFEADLSQWVGYDGGTHNGAIVEDALRPGNHVVEFTVVSSGGDAFSNEITPANWPVTVSFEYRGLAGIGYGYLGWAYGLTESEVEWLAGAEDYPSPWVHLVDDGQWRYYQVVLNFDPSFETFRVVVEDHGVGPENAFFDDISVVAGCHLVGDLNCDCAVNTFDIDPFVLTLTDSEQYCLSYPGCRIENADCNRDGAVNTFDIDPFVALLTGG